MVNIFGFKPQNEINTLAIYVLIVGSFYDKSSKVMKHVKRQL
jgi:hypothetical protein